MAHELDTRLNRRVCQVLYAPEEDDEELLGLDEDLAAPEPDPDQPVLDPKDVNCYIRLLDRFPYVVIIIVVLLSVGNGLCVYFLAPLPDFQDPTKGFETRGTPIHNHAYTLKNLWEHKDVQFSLVPNLTQVYDNFGIPDEFRGSPLNPFHGSRKRRSSEHDADGETEIFGRRLQKDGRRKRSYGDEDIGPCGTYKIDWNPKQNTYKFLFQEKNLDDLLTLENLRSICRLESNYIKPHIIPNCLVKSLPRKLMNVRNKTQSWHCESLQQSDVDFLTILLETCSIYYYNETLPSSSTHQNVSPKEMPELCATYADFLRDVLYYMAPMNYYKDNIGERDRLTSVLSFVERYAMVNDSYGLYTGYFEGKVIMEDNVKLVAMSMPDQNDVKYRMFRDYLTADLKLYFSLAMGLILLLMLLYSRSLILMLATVLNVGFSFTLACGIYFFVLQIKFYPFINLLAGLVLIAVGADDVFIFYDTWQKIREKDTSVPFSHVLSRTFSHAALSIFVTSFTTASAFFVNVVSDITCIQCFGIFSGVAILVNFTLMITWTPAVIVCMEKYSRYLSQKVCQKHLPRGVQCWTDLITKLRSISIAIFDRFLAWVVAKLWFVWVFIFLAIGIGSMVIVFVKPKLKLPESQDFQLFPDSMLLENWDKHFQDKFDFMVESRNAPRIPLYFLFGFRSEDKGNKLDPDDQGSNMTMDTDFDFYAPETQMFLLDFCNSLKNQSFLQHVYTHEACAISSYGIHIENYCNQAHVWYSSYVRKAGCCTKYKPPYDEKQLRKCLPGLQILMGNAAKMLQGEPIYDKENNVKGFLMYVHTNLERTMSYEVMDEHYKTIKAFFDKQMEGAPVGLQSGFVTGAYDFTFYDLQHAIANGTYYSIGLSLAVALIVMFLTSLNAVITLYAIITITMAISGTVAAIVLLGWHLNIVESITISLAVGLSIDFTIHYGVAYRLSKAQDSKSRVDESFAHVGSAVAMAALTTFSAGMAMLPSHILAYSKLGIFLMLVMGFSWLYATFFFQSVCRIIGPRGNFCQISTKKCRCCKEKTATEEDDNQFSNRLRFVTDDDDDDYLITF